MFMVSGWSVNSILTLQSGFPFTPQLSYNPSNNGDTRNPVRPFVNPEFPRASHSRQSDQWFNPSAFLAPPANSGFFGNLGRDTLTGPGLATWDFSTFKDTQIRERLTVAVPRRDLQPAQPRQLQHAEPDRLHTHRSFRYGRRHHQYLDHFAAGPVRPEASLVDTKSFLGLRVARMRAHSLLPYRRPTRL